VIAFPQMVLGTLDKAPKVDLNSIHFDIPTDDSGPGSGGNSGDNSK